MDNLKLKRKVYESKKARDILDEEFTEFLPTKRNVNEFFNLYNSKFYSILKSVHKFFSEQSLKYVRDYINPKKIQEQELIKQVNQIRREIDSIEKFHPLFPNNVVLQKWTEPGTPDSEKDFYFLQSAKKRKIIGDTLLNKIKDNFRKGNQPTKQWTINVPISTINGIPSGPSIKTEKDIQLPIYNINTGKVLPPNIYNIDTAAATGEKAQIK